MHIPFYLALTLASQHFRSAIATMSANTFILQNGKSRLIEPTLGPNDYIEVSSFFPPLEGVDGTQLNIKAANGDLLLHVGLRPNENVIVLNAKPAGRNWDKEVRVSYQDNIPSSKVVKIGILDRGDNYLVTFSDGTSARYPKVTSLVNENASLIEYLSSGCPILSNPVNVSTRQGAPEN